MACINSFVMHTLSCCSMTSHLVDTGNGLAMFLDSQQISWDIHRRDCSHRTVYCPFFLCPWKRQFNTQIRVRKWFEIFFLFHSFPWSSKIKTVFIVACIQSFLALTKRWERKFWIGTRDWFNQRSLAIAFGYVVFVCCVVALGRRKIHLACDWHTYNFSPKKFQNWSCVVIYVLFLLLMVHWLNEHWWKGNNHRLLHDDTNSWHSLFSIFLGGNSIWISKSFVVFAVLFLDSVSDTRDHRVQVGVTLSPIYTSILEGWWSREMVSSLLGYLLKHDDL